jgi:hypothetical protein
MAFASYTNDRRVIGEDPAVLGQFREKDYGKRFEFAERLDFSIFSEFPHQIFVGEAGEVRYGLVKKTVAYVVVDEDEYGEPVVSKWQIKNLKEYNYET